MNNLAYMTQNIVFSICSILITLYVVPYLSELQKNERYRQLFELIATAVRAAEQTIKEAKMGAAKKEKVMTSVKKYVEENHIGISDDKVSDMIESAVFEMNQEKNKV